MKVGGQIPWNVTSNCETSQICYLMGRRPTKDHLKDRLFHSVHWLSIILLLRRTSPESINLERKFYLDCSSDTYCTRGKIERTTYCLQTLRSWKRWTHRKFTQKDSIREEDISQRKKKINFPIADGRIKPLGGDQDLRASTLIRQRPIQGESSLDSFGKSEWSLPKITTRFWMSKK